MRGKPRLLQHAYIGCQWKRFHPYRHHFFAVFIIISFQFCYRMEMPKTFGEASCVAIMRKFHCYDMGRSTQAEGHFYEDRSNSISVAILNYMATMKVSLLPLSVKICIIFNHPCRGIGRCIQSRNVTSETPLGLRSPQQLGPHQGHLLRLGGETHQCYPLPIVQNAPAILRW